MIIIQREYRSKEKLKRGKPYTQNEKWYLYRCLDCGNEDWVREDALISKRPCGCNACCVSPSKIVKGVNDISTTAPWMMVYFVDQNDVYTNTKYSKKYVDMKCPDCGRIHHKQIHQVMSNHGLSCVCSDGQSYPNKFIYSVLEQCGVDFHPEMKFDWSCGRFYDEYIEHHGKRIIVEMHGKQHYSRPVHVGGRYRNLDEEKQNDVFKRDIAKENSIDYYFAIDSSESDCDYIKNNIVSSGLLDVLDKTVSDINWVLCDSFATSNFAKMICDYKNSHGFMTIKEIAKIFRISYKTALGYIQTGAKFGWCTYTILEDREKLDLSNAIEHGAKPLFCEDVSMYFRSANDATDWLEGVVGKCSQRAVRKSIDRGSRYKGYKFQFVTREEFNKAKSESPDKVVGGFFISKENLNAERMQGSAQ